MVDPVVACDGHSYERVCVSHYHQRLLLDDFSPLLLRSPLALVAPAATINTLSLAPCHSSSSAEHLLFVFLLLRVAAVLEGSASRLLSVPLLKKLTQTPLCRSFPHHPRRRAIQTWFKRNVTSPYTGARLHSAMLLSNHNLRKAIEEWVEWGWPAPRPMDQARWSCY